MDANPVTHPASLAQAIRANILFELSKVNTCLPGSVEKYDSARRRAHIKPQLQKRLPGGKTQSLPVIPGVPVQFLLSTSRGGLRFDLARGDTGLILFAQRSIDEWLAKGGDSDPKDVRRFALSDAIFIPGVQPFTGNDSAAAGALVIDYDGAQIKFKDGKIAIGGPGAELLDLLDQVVTKLMSTVVQTAVGTYPLSTAVSGELLIIKQFLALIKGSL